MIIEIKVKTASRESKVVVSETGSLTVHTKNRPIDNEANDEVVDLLTKYYQTARSSIKIKNGFKSKHKIIEIN